MLKDPAPRSIPIVFFVLLGIASILYVLLMANVADMGSSDPAA